MMVAKTTCAPDASNRLTREYGLTAGRCYPAHRASLVSLHSTTLMESLSIRQVGV